MSAPSERAPHRWRSQAVHNLHVCAFLPLPCQFLSSLCLGSPQLPPSSVHPCHLIFPKDLSHPAAHLLYPQPTGEARSPLQSAPDTLSRVLNSQCLELFTVILLPCWSRSVPFVWSVPKLSGKTHLIPKITAFRHFPVVAPLGLSRLY